jgi:hypothetical protein
VDVAFFNGHQFFVAHFAQPPTPPPQPTPVAPQPTPFSGRGRRLGD